MSYWLNYLVATPLVGVAFRESFYAPSVYSRAAEFIFANPEPNPENEGLRLGVTENSNFTFETSSGHSTSMSSNGVISRFRYPLTVDDSNPLHYERQAIEPRPYEQLLSEVVGQLEHYCTCVNSVSDQSKIKAYRIGVVMFLVTKRELLPPGLSARLDQMDPDNSLVALNHNEVIDLETTDTTIDRCHYTFGFDTAGNSDKLSVKFDWQRIWPDNVPLNDIISHIGKVAETALTHFDEAGSNV